MIPMEDVGDFLWHKETECLELRGQWYALTEKDGDTYGNCWKLDNRVMNQLNNCHMCLNREVMAKVELTPISTARFVIKEHWYDEDDPSSTYGFTIYQRTYRGLKNYTQKEVKK